MSYESDFPFQMDQIISASVERMFSFIKLNLDSTIKIVNILSQPMKY